MNEFTKVDMKSKKKYRLQVYAYKYEGAIILSYEDVAWIACCSVFSILTKNTFLLRNISLYQRGYLDEGKACISALYKLQKQSSNTITLGNKEMLFHCSTRYKKVRMPESFAYFSSHPVWQLPYFSFSLILSYE